LGLTRHGWISEFHISLKIKNIPAKEKSEGTHVMSSTKYPVYIFARWLGRTREGLPGKSYQGDSNESCLIIVKWRVQARYVGVLGISLMWLLKNSTHVEIHSGDGYIQATSSL
jgi:hypothetical protein